MMISCLGLTAAGPLALCSLERLHGPSPAGAHREPRASWDVQFSGLGMFGLWGILIEGALRPQPVNPKVLWSDLFVNSCVATPQDAPQSGPNSFTFHDALILLLKSPAIVAFVSFSSLLLFPRLINPQLSGQNCGSGLAGSMQHLHASCLLGWPLPWTDAYAYAAQSVTRQASRCGSK